MWSKLGSQIGSGLLVAGQWTAATTKVAVDGTSRYVKGAGIEITYRGNLQAAIECGDVAELKEAIRIARSECVRPQGMRKSSLDHVQSCVQLYRYGTTRWSAAVFNTQPSHHPLPPPSPPPLPGT